MLTLVSLCLQSGFTSPLFLCVAAGGQRGGYAVSALGEKEDKPHRVAGAASAAPRFSSRFGICDSKSE